MTGFDIFSAVGSVGEDLLEESETSEKSFVFNGIKRFGTSYIPMLAAAACLAFFALGLRHIYRDIGIEQPVPNDSLTSAAAYSEPAFSDLVSETSETDDDAYSETSSAETSVETEVTGFEETVTAAAEITETAAPSVTLETAYTKETADAADTAGTSVTEKTASESTETEVTEALTEEETQEPFITETESADTTVNIFIPYFPWETEIKTSFAPNPPVTGSDNAGIEDDDEEYVDDDDCEIVDPGESEAYIFLYFGGNTYVRTEESFEKSELTFLESGEIYNMLPDDDPMVSKSCEIYKINDLSENYMLAVFTGEGDYVGFRNYGYKPNSLGEYAADINFLNRNHFAVVREEAADGSGYTEYTVPDLRQALERLILSVPEAAVSENCGSSSGVKRYVVQDSGYSSSAAVYENGYILIKGETFDIGAEYAAAFVSYIESNGVKSEFFPYEDPVENEDIEDDIVEYPN